MPLYVVVLRGPSGVRIALDKPTLTIRKLSCKTGQVDLVIRTYLSEEGFEVPLPRGIWVDARGEAPSLDEAISSFWNASAIIMGVLALTTNANNGPLEVELAYDNTPQATKREFLQRCLRQETGIPSQGRNCDCPATVALLTALERSPEIKRLSRAIVQYHLALSYLKPGHETLCLNHLFIGIEALTDAALRRLCIRLNKTDREIALDWGISTAGPDRKWKGILLAEVRKRIVFQGDNESHKAAKAASDGFEHGYMDLYEVHSTAKVVRDKTASYLRSAILDLLEMDENAKQRLEKEPYRTPLETWMPWKQVRGAILGDASHLGAKNQEYPILKWQSSISSVSRTENGEYVLRPDEKMTVHLAEGLTFEPHSVEVWGPEKEKPD